MILAQRVGPFTHGFFSVDPRISDLYSAGSADSWESEYAEADFDHMPIIDCMGSQRSGRQLGDVSRQSLKIISSFHVAQQF